MRSFLLSQVRRKVGPDVDMAHFTPSYMPWDERLCAVPDGDLFEALRTGQASVVTDHIETFTENGILLKSGETLEADIIVTATGLSVQMLGGMKLSVDGEARELHDQMTYKGVLVEDLPNLAWIFGYTNAPWTLKSDIAGKYLCRLLPAHGRQRPPGRDPARPRDSALDMGMLDQLQSGYVQRAKDTLPRQGDKHPWKVLMHYGQDSAMLLDEPVDDGLLDFEAPVAAARRWHDRARRGQLRQRRRTLLGLAPQRHERRSLRAVGRPVRRDGARLRWHQGHRAPGLRGRLRRRRPRRPALRLPRLR